MANKKAGIIIAIAIVIVAVIFIIPHGKQSQSVATCSMSCSSCEDAAKISNWWAIDGSCTYDDFNRCFTEMTRFNYGERARFTTQDVNGVKTAICTGSTTPACSDTDSGNDIYNKGTVVFGNTVSFTDYCNGNFQVLEYYCLPDNSNVGDDWINCPSGYECSNGACKAVTTTTLAQTCSDSDNGDVPTVAGQVIFYNNAGDNGVQGDYCIGTSQIKEGKCNGNVFTQVTENCPSGTSCQAGVNADYCKSGTVTQYYCIDPDGQNPNTKTTSNALSAAYGSQQATDVCSGSNSVTEVICTSGVLGSVNLNCDSGKVCFDGACQAQSSTTFSTSTIPPTTTSLIYTTTTLSNPTTTLDDQVMQQFYYTELQCAPQEYRINCQNAICLEYGSYSACAAHLTTTVIPPPVSQEPNYLLWILIIAVVVGLYYAYKKGYFNALKAKIKNMLR